MNEALPSSATSSQVSTAEQEISSEDERERDEVVKRMIATPPQPKPQPPKREKKSKA